MGFQVYMLKVGLPSPYYNMQYLFKKSRNISAQITVYMLLSYLP